MPNLAGQVSITHLSALNNSLEIFKTNEITSYSCFSSILCPCVILPKQNSKALQIVDDINRGYQVGKTKYDCETVQFPSQE